MMILRLYAHIIDCTTVMKNINGVFGIYIHIYIHIYTYILNKGRHMVVQLPHMHDKYDNNEKF